MCFIFTVAQLVFFDFSYDFIFLVVLSCDEIVSSLQDSLLTPTADSSEKTGAIDLNLWTQFSQRSARCIVKIVDFAKQIPGFINCTIADQITLIKAASMDVLVGEVCSEQYLKLEQVVICSFDLLLFQQKKLHFASKNFFLEWLLLLEIFYLI